MSTEVFSGYPIEIPSGDSIPVIGMDVVQEIISGLSPTVIAIYVKHFQGAFIDEPDSTILNDENAFGGVVENKAIPFLAVAHFFFVPFLSVTSIPTIQDLRPGADTI